MYDTRSWGAITSRIHADPAPARDTGYRIRQILWGGVCAAREVAALLSRETLWHRIGDYLSSIWNDAYANVVDLELFLSGKMPRNRNHQPGPSRIFRTRRNNDLACLAQVGVIEREKQKGRVLCPRDVVFFLSKVLAKATGKSVKATTSSRFPAIGYTGQICLFQMNLPWASMREQYYRGPCRWGICSGTCCLP